MATVMAIICGVLAIGFLAISVLQFLEKGFLFHNAYIWASRQEREAMDKQPYYRQSGIVFSLSGALFLCMALECVVTTGWLWSIVGLLAIAILAYAIVSNREK